jgi:predicted lysophospholipase L1 biosynthesis ABC-type transport system permease subunit
MANILSLAMILFSIVCIVMFIVNMLQSYFQKVKRNIGTFKAFGINSNELIGVYVLIIFAIVMIAVIQSVAFVWIIEILLDAFDSTYDESV